MRKIRRKLMLLVLALIAFVLQCTFMRGIALASVSPNLLIAVTALSGYLCGEGDGMFTGFFCGLFMDLFFGSIIGIYTLIYVLCGFANGWFRRMYYEEGIWLPLIFIAATDLASNLAVFICFFLLRGRFAFAYYLIHLMIPEAIYTVIIGIPVYAALHSLLVRRRRLEKGQENPFVSPTER